MSKDFSVKSRSGDYHVHFISDFSKQLQADDSKDRYYIIDAKVLELYPDALKNLAALDRTIILPAVEDNKTLENCNRLVLQLIDKSIKRNHTLVAIGGGIVQDVTAFIASILFRGIKWEFYPTTLLAQADSCIGSKSSINVGAFKNQVGTFYPPTHIYCDVCFLQTLSESEIKSGIGEILHFYFINGTEKVNELRDRYPELLKSPQNLQDFIIQSLMIKKDTIERDELDKGERLLFNYGHTFGHALEAVTNYGVPHGQAVTLGMDIANHVALKIGMLSEKDFQHMHTILQMNKPQLSLNEEQMQEYFVALSKDKKNIGNDLVCILSRGPGAMERVQTPLNEELKNTIRSYF